MDTLPRQLHHSITPDKIILDQQISPSQLIGMQAYQREDDDEASAKETGSSLTSYSEFEAVGYGRGRKRTAHQLYTLRRNPMASKRLEDQSLYAMKILASRSKAAVNPLKDKGYVCRECGREFGSSKALFGHMRCHPEREWRGIHRPKRELEDFVVSDHKQSSGSDWRTSPFHPMIHPDSENNSDAESLEVAHLREKFNPNLQSWRRKRLKRSHATVNRLKTSTVLPSDPEAKGAQVNRYMVDCLLMLAYAGEVQEELDQARKSGRAGVWDRSKGKRPEFENDDPHPDHNKSNKSLFVQKEEIRRFQMFISEADGDDETMELHGGDGDGDGDGDAKSKFECISCMKVFKSHHALGGHRASHRKVKGCFAKAHVLELGAEDPQEHLGADLDIPNQKPTCQIDRYMHAIHAGDKNFRAKNSKKRNSDISEGTRVHSCSICLRIFASGQALGGHKRCHWGGTGFMEPINLQPSCQKQDIEELERQRKITEDLLDLNLPAPEKEEPTSFVDVKGKSTLNHQIKIKPSTIVRIVGHNQLLTPISSEAHRHFMKSSTSIEPLFSDYASTCKNALMQESASASPELQCGDDADFLESDALQQTVCDEASTSTSNLISHRRTCTST